MLTEWLLSEINYLPLGRVLSQAGWSLKGECNTQSSESETWTYGCSTWSLGHKAEMLVAILEVMYIFLSHEAKSFILHFQNQSSDKPWPWWGSWLLRLVWTVLFQRTITAAGLMIPSPQGSGADRGSVIGRAEHFSRLGSWVRQSSSRSICKG